MFIVVGDLSEAQREREREKREKRERDSQVPFLSSECLNLTAYTFESVRTVFVELI